jgi:type I restriction enzyme, S subunit
MAGLRTYEKYRTVKYDYVSQLPVDWKLLPNIAIFQERIERGRVDEELLSVTIGKGIIRQVDVDIKKDSSNEDKSKYKLINVGDIAYNKMRMWQGALGYSDYQGISSPAYVILKPKLKINPRFFHYMFRSGFYTNYSKRFSYGIVDDQLSLRYTHFKRMYSIVPPLGVQNRILAYLDKKINEIDKFIRNKERLVELLEERKKKVISKNIAQWIHTELKESGVFWIGKIPTHWSVLNLKYLLKSKLKYGANEEAKDANPGHPRYIRITDFGFDGKLSDDTFRSLPFKKAKEYLLNEGDILFARSGATVGKTFQFKEYNGLACFAGYLIKASPNDKKILSDFLYLYTQSSLYEEWKNRIFDKATIENIGADKYAVLKVIVPPIDEQIQIIAFVQNESSEINLAISKAQKEISSIKEYREALITDMVTGKRSISQPQRI